MKRVLGDLRWRWSYNGALYFMSYATYALFRTLAPAPRTAIISMMGCILLVSALPLFGGSLLFF